MSAAPPSGAPSPSPVLFPAPSGASPLGPASETLRVVTLNLWNEQGPWQRRLELCARELARLAPDVIALQEVRVAAGRVPNTAEWLRDRVGALLAGGPAPRAYACAYCPATPWGDGEEGLALLSALPVEQVHVAALPHSSDTERRVVLGASLATGRPAPGGLVHVFTTHLTYRLADGLKRQAQARALDVFVADAVAGRPGVRLLAGDLNATPEADEIRFLRGEHALEGRTTAWQDAYLAARPHDARAGGYTWAARNPYPVAWLQPDRRIDYVLVSPVDREGRGRVLDSRIVLDRAAPDGVYPSDHFGVFAAVQLATDREYFD